MSVRARLCYALLARFALIAVGSVVDAWCTSLQYTDVDYHVLRDATCQRHTHSLMLLCEYRVDPFSLSLSCERVTHVSNFLPDHRS